MNDIKSRTLNPNGNWVFVSRGGGETLFRYISEDMTHVWMMEIGTAKNGKVKIHKPAATRKLRVKWRKADVGEWLRAKRLRHVDERGIPEPMALAEIPQGVDADIDKKRALVSYILETWGDDALMTEQGYTEAIRHASDIYEVSLITARKWLESNLFYGGHPNANIPQDWNKGGPGASRRGLRDARGEFIKNMGRPTDAERIDPNTIHRRKRLTPKKYSEWCNFVKLQAWANNDEIRVILDRFKLGRVGFNRAEDGTLQAFPQDPKYFPDDYRMRQVGRPVLNKARHERDLARKHQPGFRRETAGGSAGQLAHEDLSVLDIDGTIADNFLCFGDQLINIDGHGKPTVLLAADRGSSAIAGWYVTFGVENGDCYRNCVFSAYTPKERELIRWGVPHLKGMVYGCASQIFIDRGPGISKATQDAIVERLRTDMLMAQPGDPQGKGHAEGVMGMFQEELKHILGSTHKTGNDDEDRKRQKHARRNAVSMRIFMQALLTAISRWNLLLDVRHLLTPAMMEEGVKPVPFDIYVRNQGLRGGDFEGNWPEEKIYRNLCVTYKDIKAPNGIVTIQNRQYKSTDLQTFARLHEKLHGGKSLLITAYEMPNAPLYLLWERPGGNLDVLDATGQTEKAFGDGTRWLHDFVGRCKNAALREARHASRRAPTVTETVASGSVSAATHKDMENVEKSASPKVAGTTSLSESKRKAKAYEQQQNVDATLEAMGSPHRTTAPTSKPNFISEEWLLSDDEQELFTK